MPTGVWLIFPKGKCSSSSTPVTARYLPRSNWQLSFVFYLIIITYKHQAVRFSIDLKHQYHYLRITVQNIGSIRVSQHSSHCKVSKTKYFRKLWAEKSTKMFLKYLPTRGNVYKIHNFVCMLILSTSEIRRSIDCGKLFKTGDPLQLALYCCMEINTKLFVLLQT